jgi:hypothetical protein
MNPNELLQTEVTPAIEKATEAYTNRCTYTTTALCALALFHAENGDLAGATLLREFAKRFAAHEAETL